MCVCGVSTNGIQYIRHIHTLSSIPLRALQYAKWLEELIGGKGCGDTVFSSNFGFGCMCVRNAFHNNAEADHISSLDSKIWRAPTKRPTSFDEPNDRKEAKKRKRRIKRRKELGSRAVASRSRCGCMWRTTTLVSVYYWKLKINIESRREFSHLSGFDWSILLLYRKLSNKQPLLLLFCHILATPLQPNTHTHTTCVRSKHCL